MAVRLWCHESPAVLLATQDYDRLVDQFPAWRAVARPTGVRDNPAVLEDRVPEMHGVGQTGLLELIRLSAGETPQPAMAATLRLDLTRLGGSAALRTLIDTAAAEAAQTGPGAAPQAQLAVLSQPTAAAAGVHPGNGAVGPKSLPPPTDPQGLPKGLPRPEVPCGPDPEPAGIVTAKDLKRYCERRKPPIWSGLWSSGLDWTGRFTDGDRGEVGFCAKSLPPPEDPKSLPPPEDPTSLPPPEDPKSLPPPENPKRRTELSDEPDPDGIEFGKRLDGPVYTPTGKVTAHPISSGLDWTGKITDGDRGKVTPRELHQFCELRKQVGVA